MKRTFFRKLGKAACIYWIVGCSLGILATLSIVLPVMFQIPEMGLPMLIFGLAAIATCLVELILASIALAKLNRQKKPQKEEASSSSPREEGIAETKDKQCPNCGYRLIGKDAASCPICGTKL